MANKNTSWQRTSYDPNITDPSLPPIKKNFFEEKELDGDHSTPLHEEGTQNTGDNSQLGKKPKIRISLVKIPFEFFNQNLVNDDFKKHLSISTALETKNRKIFDNNHKEIPCLLFEDFNTTGIMGDPNVPTRRINGKRNDFRAFWWSIFSGDKERGKGGSVGIGRLTFAFSSDIQTFFSFSVPYDSEKGKKFFCGLSVLGKGEDKDGYTLDPFARFGTEDERLFKPVMDEDLLKKYHKGLKLTRGFDEPGLSMIVPFPTTELNRWNLINKNIVNRYRYAIFNDQIELEINGKILSKETINDFIKKKRKIMRVKMKMQKKYLLKKKTLKG